MNELTSLTYHHFISIKIFLCMLERSGISWSALKDNLARIEKIVNDGMIDKTLRDSTRAALNKAFGLELLGPSRHPQIRIVLNAEHTALMGTVPSNLSKEHFKMIRVFFRYMEEKELSWSMAIKQSDDANTELEKLVERGISEGRLRKSIRNALKLAFGLSLRYKRKRFENPEHVTLIEKIRGKISASHASNIRTFFRYLESRGSSWSDLVSRIENGDFVALEEMVRQSEEARPAGTTRLRGALNSAFDLNL